MSAVDDLRDAYGRTVAAGSARVELTVRHHYEWPTVPRRRRGGLLRPVLSIGWAGLRGAGRLAARRFQLSGLTGTGYVDLSARRYMIDFGDYAGLGADDRRWRGLSGSPLADRTEADADDFLSPLWLLDLLGGVVEASELEPEDLRGARVRHVTTTVDVSRASAAAPNGIAIPPSTERFEELLALPVEVWFDASHLRRVRYGSEHQTLTLELLEVAVPLDGLDWTRLPAFRSAGEAEGSTS